MCTKVRHSILPDEFVVFEGGCTGGIWLEASAWRCLPSSCQGYASHHFCWKWNADWSHGAHHTGFCLFWIFVPWKQRSPYDLFNGVYEMYDIINMINV